MHVNPSGDQVAKPKRNSEKLADTTSWDNRTLYTAVSNLHSCCLSFIIQTQKLFRWKPKHWVYAHLPCDVLQIRYFIGNGSITSLSSSWWHFIFKDRSSLSLTRDADIRNTDTFCFVLKPLNHLPAAAPRALLFEHPSLQCLQILVCLRCTHCIA